MIRYVGVIKNYLKLLNHDIKMNFDLQSVRKQMYIILFVEMK